MIRYKILMMLFFVISSTANAITIGQINTLSFIKRESRKYTNYPSAIAAICLTESSAGINRVGDERKSLGLMQIQVDTVRWLASKDKSLRPTNKLSRYDIKKLLLWDDRFSIEVACKYFEYYRKRGGFEYAIGMYNGGGLANKKYIQKVKKNMKFTRLIK